MIFAGVMLPPEFKVGCNHPDTMYLQGAYVDERYCILRNAESPPRGIKDGDKVIVAYEPKRAATFGYIGCSQLVTAIVLRLKILTCYFSQHMGGCVKSSH